MKWTKLQLLVPTFNVGKSVSSLQIYHSKQNINQSSVTIMKVSKKKWNGSSTKVRIIE